MNSITPTADSVPTPQDLVFTSLPQLQDWIANQDLARQLKSAGMIAFQFGPGLDPAVALPILKQAVIDAMEDAA